MNIVLIDFNPFMDSATPVSLGYLGAALKKEGHNVNVMSLGSDTPFSPNSFQKFVKEFNPGLVGFGTYQRNIFHVNSMSSLVKQAAPLTRIILGGPQITFLPDDALAVLTDVDYLSRGEGESTIIAAARAIEAGLTGEQIPGITSRSPEAEARAEAVYQTGEPPPLPKDLDSYPSPWLEGILDPSDREETIMLTSRGCSYKCSFCYTPKAFGPKIRAHSVDRVLEDIAYVVDKGTGRLWFADPNFSFSAKRVREILEGILKQGIKVDMWIETRADMLSKELLSLMRKAGVSMIAMGLESASENVYPCLNKKIEPEKIREAIGLIFDAGMDVELFSQYALPNESFDDAMKTLKFVKDSGVKIQGNSNAQQMQIYWGSEIARDPEKHGIKPLRKNLLPCMAIGTEFETEWMSKAEIDKVKAAWKSESLDGGKRIVS